MRTVEQLIDMSRKLSKNTRYDANSGIPQDVFVQFANNAQDSLVKQITNLKTKYFKKEFIVDVVPNQEVYAYPDDCLAQHLDTLQWTDNISGTYWQTLYKSYTKEKITLQPGYPFSYIPYEDGVHLNPPITRGKLYFTFIRALPKLQKRSGKIQALSINAQNQLVALNLDSTECSYDEKEINQDYFLCVVDKFGAIKARDIPYNSVSGGVFDLSPYTLRATDSITVGDFILVGKYTGNKPEFPDICESYIIKHMVYDAKYNDSSQWTQEAKDDMARSFTELSGLFASLSDDINEIPITNLDYIGF